MKRYERIITIIMLTVVSLSNVATPVAYAAPLLKFHLAFPLGVPFDKSGLTKAPHFNIPDQGSVLGASTTLFTVGTQKLDIDQAGNAGSAYQRIPLQVQQLDKKVYATTEDVAVNVLNPDNEAFTTSVQDATGKSVSVPITESNTGPTTTVDLAPSNELKPGLYKVTITDAENKSTEQDFTWGVLALNTDKSVYHPNDTANISMAVLNDKGDMVCDADVNLQIVSPNGGVENLSNKNGKILVNPQCQKHDYSLQPDYETHYQFTDTGVYHFQLSATTTNGSHTISDSIQVEDKIPFDIQRVSATRIYPPNTYPMIFNITANRDFSGTVTETVPDSFTVTPATQSAAQSYNAMQTVYLNSNDPASVMSQQIASGSGGLVMPFHGDFPITQGFGAQLTDPILQAFYTHYGLGGHDGIDFGLPMNTPLYAVDNGDVIWAGPGDYGTMVTIKHNWGQTYYGHMTSVSVTVGQHVAKDQLIGYSGMTGEATGPHLHFGMKPNNPDMGNGYYGKIDPMPFLPIGKGEPIAALGASTNPLANLVYNTTVLGASDSAATPTPSDTPSLTPTEQPIAEPSPSTLTPTPTTSTTASQAAEETVSPTPASSPTTNIDTTWSNTATPNSKFSVLDKEIKINEEIANSALTEKVKVLTWNVDLKKGQSTTLGYDYQTPKESPQFYLMGPAKLYDDKARVVFQEQRQWQIAADDVGVEWFQDTTGRQWNGYSWQYRKKIVIDHTKTSAGLYTNRPTVTFMEPGTDATQDLSLFQQGTPGTCFSDSTLSETGPRSLKCTSGAGGSVSFMQNNVGAMSDSGTRVSTYVYLQSLPTGQLGIMQFKAGAQGVGGNSIFNVTVDQNGLLTMQNNSGVQLGGNAQSLKAGTWYRIGISYVIVSTTHYNINVYVNGVQEIADSCNSCGTTLGFTGITHVRFGWCVASVGNNSSINFDDIYIDNGTDLGDPGDIHITNKRPLSNGTTNNFTGAGTPSGYGTGNARYVNEQPLNLNNNVAVTTTAAKTEEYSVEATTAGDVDLSKNTLLADCGWIQASASATLNAVEDIIVNGTATSFTVNSQFAYEGCANSNTFPAGNTDIGMDGHYTSGSGTFTLAEAGYLIAYIPSSTAQFMPTSITPEFMDDGGDATNTNGGTNFTTSTGGFYSGSSGTVAYDTSTKETGPGSIKFTSGGGGAVATLNANAVLADAGRRISTYYNFTNLPTGNLDILLAETSGAAKVFTLQVTSGGVLQLTNGSGTQIGSSGDTLSTATWYRIDVSYKITSTSNYSITVYLNGKKSISYSQTSGGTALANSGSNELFLGWGTASVGNSKVMNIDNIYVDNGSDLSDIGDVRVTTKQPISDGASNGFGTNGSAAGTTCTSGTHCEYVNERPLSTSNNLSTSTANTRENFTLQSASQGDVDISNAGMLAAEPWVYAKTSSACTAQMTSYGADTIITLSTSDTMIASLSANFNFLSGTQGIGMQSCNSTQTVTLEEAGVMVAYTPNNPGNTLTNFPVVFNDNSDADVGGHAQSSGNDVVFTDSTGRNLLNFEIESFSVSSGQATMWAWIQIPSLSTTTDTIIYMYYGNPAAASKAAASSVWDPNYTMVQHLEESTACGTNIFSDSTSGGFTGTCNGSGPTADATGQIGPARTFSGSGQFISISNDSKFSPTIGPFSVTEWINPTSVNTGQLVFSQLNAGNTVGWGAEIGNIGASGCNTNGFICFYDGSSNMGVASGLVASTWQQIGYVRSGSSIVFYVNGSSVGSSSSVQSAITTSTNSEFIGSGATGGFPFGGNMDEVRYSQEALSPGWIKTEYNDENAPTNGNFFNALGSEETKIYAPTLSQLMRHGQWFDSTGTIQPFVF